MTAHELETAIINITVMIDTLDVIIDYVTDKDTDRDVASTYLITMGRHLEADLKALREAFYGPSEGGAA